MWWRRCVPPQEATPTQLNFACVKIRASSRQCATPRAVGLSSPRRSAETARIRGELGGRAGLESFTYDAPLIVIILVSRFTGSVVQPVHILASSLLRRVHTPATAEGTLRQDESGPSGVSQSPIPRRNSHLPQEPPPISVQPASARPQWKVVGACRRVRAVWTPIPEAATGLRGRRHRPCPPPLLPRTHQSLWGPSP